jgi:hypothetical protein
MAILLYFGQDNHVEKQVRMAINQAGQQHGTAQIDDFDSGRRGGLHLRRRTDYLDLCRLQSARRRARGYFRFVDPAIGPL